MVPDPLASLCECDHSFIFIFLPNIAWCSHVEEWPQTTYLGETLRIAEVAERCLISDLDDKGKDKENFLVGRV